MNVGEKDGFHGLIQKDVYFRRVGKRELRLPLQCLNKEQVKETLKKSIPTLVHVNCLGAVPKSTPGIFHKIVDLSSLEGHSINGGIDGAHYPTCMCQSRMQLPLYCRKQWLHIYMHTVYGSSTKVSEQHLLEGTLHVHEGTNSQLLLLALGLLLPCEHET